jgi:hypothetical protein
VLTPKSAQLYSPVLQLSVVETDLDTDTSVDQADQSSGHSDEVTGSSVRGASVTSDIGDETTSNNEGGLSSDDTEGVHSVDNVKHGLSTVSMSTVGRKISLTVMFLLISPPLITFQVMGML